MLGSYYYRTQMKIHWIYLQALFFYPCLEDLKALGKVSQILIQGLYELTPLVVRMEMRRKMSVLSQFHEECTVFINLPTVDLPISPGMKRLSHSTLDLSLPEAKKQLSLAR